MLLLKIEGPHGLSGMTGGRYRLIQDASTAPKEIQVLKTPFVIGRAEDCHLMLPENEQLRAVTSRWHCFLMEKDGQFIVVDGSLKTLPDSSQRKASVTGTLVNERTISAPTPLTEGDVLGVGPWRFTVAIFKPKPPEPSDVFSDVVKGSGRRVESADPKLREKFGQMHELVQRLAQIRSTEESLTALLSYATTKIAPAEVAAILITRPGGGFTVRHAWQKGLGSVPDFQFSEALLDSLPPDQSFLLEARLKDRSLSQSAHDISSGLLLPVWGKGERLGILYMDNRRTGNSFTEEDLYLGSAIASVVSLQLALERQAELSQIEENMARYFAPDVVRRILEQSASGQPIGLDVQERDVSILFIDMEGFTKLSRTKTPREISEILNPYLETVARTIQGERGHVNKFIGDAVMGIFGAQPGDTGPADPALYATQAVRAALALPGVWEAEAGKRKLPPMRVRIGINSGRAVVGNIGYSARLEYSVLGDAVNIASRMEKLARPNRAAVSEATRALVEGQFEFEDLGEQEVKGVGKMRVYSPVRALS